MILLKSICIHPNKCYKSHLLNEKLKLIKMKNKLFLTLVALFILINSVYSQYTGWNYLNFESGGYVTEIIPVEYPAGQQPADISQQVLYARTDVGGIYRSTNNGGSWLYASNYINYVGLNPGITLSEIHIQGVAIRQGQYSNSPQTVVVAWGYDENDAKLNYQSIWRSDNSGVTWPSQPATIQAPGVWFNGNNFPVKIGGPCIAYDPNNTNGIYSVMYMGGFGPSDANGDPLRTYLFRSENDGLSWSKVTSFENQVPGINGEGIICISMKQGSNHIWVGTTHRVIYSTNNGQTWTVKTLNDANPYVKRIILKGIGEQTVAFLTWGYYIGSTAYTGIGKFNYNNSTTQWDYTSLTPNYGTLAGSLMSPLIFGDNENVIFAGEYEGVSTMKKSTNDGESWSAPIQLKYATQSLNNIPKHSTEFQNHPISNNDDNIYSGMNDLVKNPNPNWSNQWYMSGGAGARMTTTGVNNNDLASSRWSYSVNGQSMPVIYDVAFQNFIINGNTKQVVFTPMSDWTLAWQYTSNLTGSGQMIPTPLEYDRQKTLVECLEDTYISNVIRIMPSPTNQNISYCAGGSVYNYTNPNCEQNQLAGFYKRTVNSDGTISITSQNPSNDPLLMEPDRAIVDAVVIPSGRLIALVGVSSEQSPPTEPYTGIYYSDDEGLNWSGSSFNIPCQNPNISTQQKYTHSKISGLAGNINGTVGSLFEGHFALCYAENNRVYLWLESDDIEPYGGGLFVSTNNGLEWAAGNNPDGFDGYFGPGSLKYLGGNQIALAFRDFRSNANGLYKGTIESNGSISWQQFGGFISAEHLDFQAPGSWAVYGKRKNGGVDDEFNQIYKSLDNGNTWSKIPENSATLPYFPVVHSLRIRPAPYNNELWVATSGQGVYIYKNFQQVCVPPITNHYVITGAFENDCDITVEDGGWLEITNPPTTMPSFKMGAGKSIIVKPGGKLTCEYTIFEGIGGAEWGGITENNSNAISVDNCEIKNAPKCISLSSNSGYKGVKNTIFWVPEVSGEYGIKALNINRCYFAANSFVLGSSNTAIGININLDPINNDFSEEGDNTINSYLINGNVFSGGSQHLVINGLGGYVPPFWIMYNQFYPTYQSVGNGVWARKVHGYFKNNYFYDNGFGNAITFIECYLQMLENTVKSSQTNLNLLGTSSINMQPADDGQGQYFWNAGRNKFYLENTGDASESNINFADGCVLAGDKGENCFYLPASVKNNRHITGVIPGGDVLNMTVNYWQPTPPIYELYGETMGSLPYSDVCFGTGPISTNYDVMSIGFGITDTLFSQQRPSGGGGRSSSLTNPKYIFTECLKKKRAKHFSEAMVFAKQIINSYDTSKYFLPALDELFTEYQLSDTVKNQQARYTLFNSLALYLNSKINQYQTNSIFVDKAYRYYLMCLTKMKNYQEAITGYENIIINHSDPVIRLTASWDRASVILLMNSNSGGSEKEFYDDDFGLRFEELAKEKPIHEIANKTYSTRKQDYSQKLSMGVVKKADIEKKDKIEKRVSVFTASSKEELDVKINADIKALLGLKTTNTNSNSLIPLTYNLSQNYPNPFNPTTKIAYDLPKDAKVKLVIYDILGREMKTLVNNEFKTAGKYIVEFNGSSLSSGVYFYRLQVEGGNAYTSVKKMVLLK